MLPSLANLGCDTGPPVVRGREESGTEQNEENEPKRARKERRTPILVNGEWVRHYRHTPLNDASIGRAVEALPKPGQVAAVVAEYGPVAEWDVSEVEDFSFLFAHANDFNADLSGWDVGKATNMESMFAGATSFTSDLSRWDVGNVKFMGEMFLGLTSFTSDLSRWNVGNVVSMASMFYNATSFTSDLSTWNVGNVKFMGKMFFGALSFTSDLSRWNVGKVEFMNSMFREAWSFTSDLSKWNVGNVESMRHMFENATRFTSDLSKWNVGNVDVTAFMFRGATSFTSDLSRWNVGNVGFILQMFKGAASFGPPLDLGEDGEWTPESLAKHVAFVESSPVLKTYRARRRWREVRELWYVARSVVRALLKWAEERSIDDKTYDPANPQVRQQLEDQLEEMRKNLGLSEGSAARARRLCELVLGRRGC